MSKEKLMSHQRYTQSLRDRFAAGKFNKRDNSVFLKIDFEKTEKKIEKLKLPGESVGAKNDLPADQES